MKNLLVWLRELRDNNTLHLLESFLFWIGFTSLSAILLLIIGKFSGQFCIVLGSFIFLIFINIFKVKIIVKDNRFGLVFYLILLVAIVFRLNPYLYLVGGQDQGTYLNMSKQYRENGKIFDIDNFRSTLTRSEKETYDFYGNYLMPSFEKWNRPDSEYTMALYPLFPAWLGLTSDIIGDIRGIYIVPVFSVLSLVAFYLLAYEISGKKKLAGYIVFFLLSINPLYVFFGKFPVSETLSLMFVTFSFYYLLLYYKLAKDGSHNALLLFLSFLLINCFFYTRMSFFLYLPFYYFLAFITIAFEENKKTRTAILFYLGSILFTFIVSYLFYKTFITPLFTLVYSGTINKFLKEYLFFIKIPQIAKLYLVIFVGLFGLVVSLILCKYSRGKIQSNHVRWYLLLFSQLIFVVLFIIAGKDIYAGGFLGIEGDPRWNMPGSGWGMLKYIPLFIILEYVSPQLFILYPAAIYRLVIRKSNHRMPIAVLIIFVSLFMLYDCLLLGFFRYPYYDTRYYFSEIIPYFILLMGLFLYQIRKNNLKVLFYVMFFGTVFYYSIFSVFQFSGKEEGGITFYRNINKIVSKNDLLIVYKSHSKVAPLKYSTNFNYYALGPLKNFYDRNLLVLDTSTPLNTPGVKSIMKRFDNVFIISDLKLSDDSYWNQRTEKETFLRFIYTHFSNSPGCIIHTYEFLPIESIETIPLPDSIKCYVPPSAFYTRYRDYYLYRIKSSEKV